MDIAPQRSRPPVSSSDVAPVASHAARAFKPLRVVVADHNALLRAGLASLLNGAGHEVVATAGDAGGLLLKVRSYVPDVAIVGLRTPPDTADDGLRAAADIRCSHPTVSVLVLSRHLEPAYIPELIGDDASGVGYLLNDRVRDVAEFLDAVQRVAAGGTALDPGVVSSLVRGSSRSTLDGLTDRERAVLTLIAQGRSNRAIAKQLFLSLRAIERHVQAIFNALLLPHTEDHNRRVLAVRTLLGTERTSRPTPPHASPPAPRPARGVSPPIGVGL
jgi:DNA-binding NarL/FixJ family response regulator